MKWVPKQEGLHEITGDIWSLAEAWDAMVVVPTNTGWKKDGSNVMGRGVALQAATRFSELPMKYGAICRNERPAVRLMPKYGLIMFPTKPRTSRPWLDWQEKADLGVIERSTEELRDLPGKSPIVVLPLVGCGNGQLCEGDVVPILFKYLSNRFVLVRKG
jgi:hypothetical protein